MYYDFGITIVFFAASLYFLVRNLNNRNLFLLLFGLTTLYFASSMVRLLLILAPALSLLASVGIVGVLKPFSTLLKEPPRILGKKKLGLPRVGKEFSGVAILLIFLVLVTNFAFAPQSGGTPRVYKQVDSPVTISAGSLPIVTTQPVDEWFNLLAWTKSNLPGTTVVCSWWDYGYWLTLIGNMTTLADNATINTTQIQNVGFTFMANETASLKMLKLYNAKYILVFTTVTFDSNSAGIFAGYGDEGKWMWMARISGQARGDFINKYGFLDENSAWEDENFFGKISNETQKWEWNEVGMNTTIYKLMSYGKYRYTFDHGITDGDQKYNTPQYFKEAYFSGINDEPGKYGGIVPLVLLYEIEYPPE